MPSIGLAMIVKNEAQVIAECLQSAAHVDEIVVLDTGSTDGTQSIARKFGANVVETAWHDDFALTRNQSLRLLSTDYILVLDADERIEEGFRIKLNEFIDKHPDDLGVLTIRSPWPSPSGELNIVRSQNTRFFPRNHDVRYQGRIHEQVVDTSETRSRYQTGITLWHEGYHIPNDLLLKKTKRNMDMLMAALREQPENGYYLYQLGKSYEQLSDLSSARTCYDASLQVSTAEQGYYPELLLAALYNYKSLGLKRETWSLLDHAVQKYPTTVDFYFFLGRALIEFRISNLELIKSAFETCLTIHKEPSSKTIVEGVGSYLALYNLGVFYESTAELLSASNYYKQAALLQYDPAHKALERLVKY